MAFKEKRPVLCYRCGRVLAHREVDLSPEGMHRFRQEAEELRRRHVCGQPASPSTGSARSTSTSPSAGSATSAAASTGTPTREVAA